MYLFPFSYGILSNIDFVLTYLLIIMHDNLATKPHLLRLDHSFIEMFVTLLIHFIHRYVHARVHVFFLWHSFVFKKCTLGF